MIGRHHDSDDRPIAGMVGNPVRHPGACNRRLIFLQRLLLAFQRDLDRSFKDQIDLVIGGMPMDLLLLARLETVNIKKHPWAGEEILLFEFYALKFRTFNQIEYLHGFTVRAVSGLDLMVAASSRVA